MNDFLTAMALVLVIEGVIYALFPEGVKRMMERARDMPATSLRTGGLAAAILGVALVWLLKS